MKAWLTRAGPLVGAIGLVARSAPRELVIATLLDLSAAGLTLAQLLVVRGVLAGILAGAAGRGYSAVLVPLVLLSLLQTAQGVAGVYGTMQQQFLRSRLNLAQIAVFPTPSAASSCTSA